MKLRSAITLAILFFTLTNYAQSSARQIDHTLSFKPGFVQIKVDPESPPRVMPTRDAVENKISFRKALGVVEE